MAKKRKKVKKKMEQEEVYTIDAINHLKNTLFRKAWEKSCGDVTKYERMKREIRRRIKFRLIIEPQEIELKDILTKIVGNV